MTIYKNLALGYNKPSVRDTGKKAIIGFPVIDLQWFANAEDEGRTFEPTESTFRKAREEGRVAKSQELVAALGLLFPAIVIFLLAPGMLRTCAEMLRFFFTRAVEMELTDRAVVVVFLNYFARLALPILAVAVVAALFSNIVQVGFMFTTKPLSPDFSKILPRFGRYFQKTLFSMEGLFNLAKSIVKMIIIGVIAYAVITSGLDELQNLQKAKPEISLSIVGSLAIRLVLIVAVFILVLAIPDYLFQRWNFRQSLKMTREKYKEELKQEEGDPQVRARLRRLYRDLLSRNMLANVHKADVVITNPTHYSVAMEYDPENKINIPTVIAKGEDELALQIREIAKAHNIPVVSHPPLTRELYKYVEIGDPVPVRYWEVLIAILGPFFRADKKMHGMAG